MSHTSSPAADDGPSPELDFDQYVDRGSWAAFTPSLAHFLQEILPAGHEQGPSPYACLLLTAPHPIVTEESLASRMGLRSLLRRGSRRIPSPDLPGIVVTWRPQSIELTAPIQDQEGRYLLDPAAQESLSLLGWQTQVDLMSFTAATTEQAAQHIGRVLIEVLRVPHPADTDYLIWRP